MGPASGLVAIVIDPPVHIAQQPPDQRQTQPLPGLFGRNEGFENMLAQVRGDAWSIVADPQLDRQAQRGAISGRMQLEPAGKAGANDDPAVSLVGGGISGVGQQVDHHLHKGIGIALHWRQRGIELFKDRRRLAASLDHRAGPPHGLMEVARGQIERGPAGQRLHLVDQLGDPVNLVSDQAGQRQILAFQLAAQQLRRAADPSQRVLDFVRQDFGRTQHPALTRSRSLAQRLGPANVDQGQHLPAGLIDHRGQCQVDLTRRLTIDRNAGGASRKLGFAVTQPLANPGFGKAE